MTKRKCLIWLAAGIALIVIILGISAVMIFGRNVKKYKKTQKVFANPLMGYAPCAWNENVREDVSLLYMDITWAELEPEEGKYNWKIIDTKNQIKRWKSEGKHIVLRFVCDIPENNKHMDIPQWLYEKIGHAGTWYDTVFGKGFAPDYNNAQMVAAHEKAVQALGEHFGKDGLISYIELGSLGHWGEWHVNQSAGIQCLPDEAVREQYVLPWTKAFPNASLLMRRPFSHAAKDGMGLYNDMTGDPQNTKGWLKEIENGGDFSQTGERGGLTRMRDFWEKAPCGGEFNSSMPMEEMLGTNLTQTVKLIRQTHTTFLGPKIAEEKYTKGYETVLKNMGYRLWISKAALTWKSRGTNLKLTWENDGVAPFYQNWPVWVYVENQDGKVIEKERIEFSLSSVLPKKIVKTQTLLKTKGLSALAGKKYKLSIGIEDPMTGKPSIRLAMKSTYKKGKTFLW